MLLYLIQKGDFIMRLIYQARTKDDRQGIKNGTRKVITIPQRESLAKKYAAYAIEQYKDQGGSKKFGNKKSDILTIKCDIFFLSDLRINISPISSRWN